MFFSASIKICHFWNSAVTNDAQSKASLAEIIQCFPLLEEFDFHSQSIPSYTTFTTVKELLKIPHFSKIKKFKLGNISDKFDFEEFYQVFLKKNKTMKVELFFDSIISEGYKQKIKIIVKEIFESNSYDFWPPILNGVFNKIQHDKLKFIHEHYQKRN